MLSDLLGTKSRITKWMRQVARTAKVTTAQKIFVRKSEQNGSHVAKLKRALKY
jgi:hypothetical protein